MKKSFCFFFQKEALAFSLLCLCAATPEATSISAKGAWARATAPWQTTAAVYLVLTSREPDTLVAVSSPQAARAMLHRSSTAGGMASMSDVASLPLPPGMPVRLRPRGDHVMLEGLAHGLRPGERVSVTLHFAHAAPVTVQAPVLPIGSAGP